MGSWNRRLVVFGLLQRLPDTTPTHTALRLSIDPRSDGMTCMEETT